MDQRITMSEDRGGLKHNMAHPLADPCIPTRANTSGCLLAIL
jgi:hypothetical protein